MPRHPRSILNSKGIARKLVDCLEIHHSTVVVILTRELRLVELLRVDVGQRMVVRIPSAITRVQPSHTGDLVVDQT